MKLLDANNKQLIEQFEIFLDEYMNKFKPSIVLEASKYSLKSKGKRVRPLLLFKILQDFNIDPTIALPYALGIEMIHTFSLIHDDLPALDNDNLRRGRNTCHIEYDEATAILAGDNLLALAFNCINNDIDANKNLEIIKYMIDYSACEGMIYGQEKDIEAENITITNINDLKEIHTHKTGKLITLPLIIGCILADKKDKINDIIKVGMNIGLSFQIQDDILDVISSTEVLGKTVGSDEINNKSTYVSLLGIDKAKEEMIKVNNEAKYLYSTISNKTNLLEYIEELQQRNK